MKARKFVPATVLLATAAAMLGGCTDEKIVFRDRELFQEPPATAASFLGYTDELSKLTVCGNCHVGQQGQWVKTAHAGAWTTLQASGSAQPFCEGCHTVNERGNVFVGTGGYDGSPEVRYEDVQCESCHGPGLTHVSNPDATQPLAPFAVGIDATQGCGECHSGSHHPFVEEWSQSAHGQVNAGIAARIQADPSVYCGNCHAGKGALIALGENADYIEKDDGEVYPITCSVCHDPHGSPYPKQLRKPVGTANVDNNLCMTCHQRRAEPDPNSSRGAHSPQGPMITGEAGYRPPNFQWDPGEIIGTHGTERNPRLCAACHVASFEVTDPASGNFVFQATGHLFLAIPCLDAEGKPTTGDCADSERNFSACASGVCHGSPQAARSAIASTAGDIQDLVDEVERLVALVPASEFRSGDNLITVGEGAKFNAGLFESDGSRGTHNPFLLKALLRASRDALKSTYGIN